MKTKTAIMLAVLLCGLLMVGGGVWAMSSGRYAINWDVIGGGGGAASSADYAVMGTIGQPAAESSFSTNYGLWSGYWHPAGAAAPTNQPPYTPSNPSPGNHTANVSINADLSWTGEDPDAGDNVTYDVYFGTNTTPPLRKTIGPYPAAQSSITYNTGALAYNTTYYWQIVAKDSHGASTTGPLCDFTTAHEEVPGTRIWLWLIIAAGIAALVAIIVRVVRRKAKAQPPK